MSICFVEHIMYVYLYVRLHRCRLGILTMLCMTLFLLSSSAKRFVLSGFARKNYGGTVENPFISCGSVGQADVYDDRSNELLTRLYKCSSHKDYGKINKCRSLYSCLNFCWIIEFLLCVRKRLLLLTKWLSYIQAKLVD